MKQIKSGRNITSTCGNVKLGLVRFSMFLATAIIIMAVSIQMG